MRRFVIIVLAGFMAVAGCHRRNHSSSRPNDDSDDDPVVITDTTSPTVSSTIPSGGTTLDGRALTQIAAVTMDSNTVTKPNP